MPQGEAKDHQNGSFTVINFFSILIEIFIFTLSVIIKSNYQIRAILIDNLLPSCG